MKLGKKNHYFFLNSAYTFDSIELDGHIVPYSLSAVLFESDLVDGSVGARFAASAG